MKHLFVIDDTGSPGNKTESLILRSDRKSYLAVFINAELRKPIEIGLENIILKFKNKGLHIKEFHFTDIINRRKEFNKLTTDDILDLFQELEILLKDYYFPFFLQTVTPRTLEENGLSLIKYIIDDPKELSLDRLAINFLLLRVKEFIKMNDIQNQFEIIIDSGLKKDGKTEVISSYNDILKENIMTYRSSEKCILLQIADFFAFSINRMQMLLIKDNRTEFDVKLLKILSNIVSGNGISGVKENFIDLENYTKDDYDKNLLKDIEEKGNLKYWKKVNE